MPPPLPWVEVVRGRRTSAKDPAPSDPNAFLDLRVPKLRHHNAAFPRPNDVYTLACRIYACLGTLNMISCTLQEALSLANSDQRLLHDDIVQDIVLLSALMRQASTHPAAERWILSTIVGRSKAKAPRTDSSTSDHSVDRSRPRRRDEPSSGRGAPK